MTDEKKAEVVIDDEMKEVFNIDEQQTPKILIPEETAVEVITASEVPAVVQELDQSKLIDTDFQYARQNIYDVIEIGKKALENLADLAESAQNPRGHEVIGELMKNITESTRELIDLHKKMKELKSEESSNQKNITNNNLILTTEELLRLIKNQSTKT